MARRRRGRCPTTGPLASGLHIGSRGRRPPAASTYLTRGIAADSRARPPVCALEPSASASPWRYGRRSGCSVRRCTSRDCPARRRAASSRTLACLPVSRRHVATYVGAGHRLSLTDRARRTGIARGGRSVIARDALRARSRRPATPQGASSPTRTSHTDAAAHALRRDPISMPASSTSRKAVELSAPATARAIGTRTRSFAWRRAHRLLATDDARERTRSPLRGRSLELLPDAGRPRDAPGRPQRGRRSLGRSRREGFFGEELSEAELQGAPSAAPRAESVRQVARQLYLSPNTVKTHRRSIYRKLGVTTREAMLARAAELQIGAESCPTLIPSERSSRGVGAARVGGPDRRR